MDPLKTGKIISEARKKKNLTQTQLSDKLHVSDKAVSKWERGLCFPDISLLIPLTEILDISLSELLKGEKMKKEEVEETLKGAIDYSNKTIKKNKKRMLIFSIITILIIIIISIIITVSVKNNEIGAITDRDTLYNVTEFSAYKTSIEEDNTGNVENILGKLALSWKERTFSINKDKITIKYDVAYKDVVKAYCDEDYVKQALIYNVTVLYATISDLNKVEHKFKDISYTVDKTQIKDLYQIENLNDLTDEETWSIKVFKKLEDKNFVNETFEELFK